MDPGYPRYIRQDFPGIGSKVDAAFENYGKKLDEIQIKFTTNLAQKQTLLDKDKRSSFAHL